MTFVDLAGREDQEASANREMQYKEMCYINTSLFYLAHLITKLSTQRSQRGSHQSLADFRNSKLTLLLSQALVGNSQALRWGEGWESVVGTGCEEYGIFCRKMRSLKKANGV